MFFLSLLDGISFAFKNKIVKTEFTYPFYSIISHRITFDQPGTQIHYKFLRTHLVKHSLFTIIKIIQTITIIEVASYFQVSFRFIDWIAVPISNVKSRTLLYFFSRKIQIAASLNQ